MMLEVVCLSVALMFGLGVRYIGLPPLVGFLGAGFAINYFGDTIGIPKSMVDVLQHLAHLGVLMLLFTVGLKLKFKQVFKSEVVGGALVHFAVVVCSFAPLVYFFFERDLNTAVLIAISLAFSSTVLAAKLLETKRELSLFHGRTTIGILVIQDLIALGVLAIWSGKIPNIWALSLLALPLLRMAMFKLIDMVGHGELLVLTSMIFAIVIGGSGFEAMGLSSEIGALLMGALLANHDRASEISQSLLSVKELFLVCFFLGIGMSGLPTWNAVIFAAVFAVLLPLKTILFFFVLVRFKLRSRTAFLSALSLSSYSEFGLIVAAAVLPQYVVPIALCMTFSYIISAPLNRFAHDLFQKWECPLNKFQLDSVHPDEQPKDLGDAEILIFGMGRTGSAAYRFMESEGLSTVGLDADMYKTDWHATQGRNVLFADAEDSNFWRGIDLTKIKATILAMDDIEAKTIAARMLKKYGFQGPIISHALHEDHQLRIREAGASHTYLTMSQAGIGLAECTLLALKGNAPTTDNIDKAG